MDDFCDRFERLIRRGIKRAEREVDKEFDFIDDEDRENRLFKARAEAAKACLKAVQKAESFLLTEYKDEINYRKEDIYPRQWMLNDKRIYNALETYPLTVPLLNYLFNLNRYIKGQEYKDMVELCDSVTDGKIYNGKWNLSAFITDKAFYHDITKRFGYSKIYIQKCLKAFEQTGIILKIGTVKKGRGRPATLYADGYFVEYGDGQKRKIALLKNSREYREALKNLPEIIK